MGPKKGRISREQQSQGNPGPVGAPKPGQEAGPEAANQIGLLKTAGRSEGAMRTRGHGRRNENGEKPRPTRGFVLDEDGGSKAPEYGLGIGGEDKNRAPTGEVFRGGRITHGQEQAESVDGQAQHQQRFPKPMKGFLGDPREQKDDR